MNKNHISLGSSYLVRLVNVFWQLGQQYSYRTIESDVPDAGIAVPPV